jgi:acyl-coenzyme A thioesterase 9
MFQRPVEIGSLLFLSAMVVYVEGNKIQTRVHAEVVDIHTAQRETTNVFYFIFKAKDQDTHPLGNVVPKTYAGKNEVLMLFINVVLV